MPDIKFATADVSAMKLGTANVSRVMLGTVEVWPGGVCTDVLMENFTSVADWPGGISSVAGGRTGNMGQIGGSTSVNYTIPAINESSTITIGFAYKNSTFTATRPFLQLKSDAATTSHTTFQVNTNGSISARLGGTTGVPTLGTTATGLITANTWYYLEVQVTLHDTAGTVKLRVNGTELLNLAGIDTKNAGTKTVYDTITLFGGGSGASANYDDLYISTGAGCGFKGDITIP